MRRKGKVLGEVQRIIREAREAGERERAQAPSRSTGIRRELYVSHQALGQIEQLVEPNRED